MNRFARLVPVILIACFIQSCCYSVKCSPVELNFHLVGFSRSDVATIVIRKYVANDNFRTQKDIMMINNLASVGGYTNGDTTFLNLPTSGVLHFNISTGFDYTIQVPAANRTYLVTDIVEKQQESLHCRDEDPDYCENKIIGYKVNGVVQTKDFFFIVK